MKCPLFLPHRSPLRRRFRGTALRTVTEPSPGPVPPEVTRKVRCRRVCGAVTHCALPRLGRHLSPSAWRSVGAGIAVNGSELIFRGEQYVRAIVLFQRKYAGTFPPTIDVLLQERFLRRRYLDPITNEEFQLLYAGLPPGRARQGGLAPSVVTDGRRGILGVVSRSKQTSLRLYQDRGHYNEWIFVAGQPSIEPRLTNGSPSVSTGERDK